MALSRATVKLTANFESNLVSINAFWAAREAPQAFLQLLQDLETVIGNLERYPVLGRSFLDRAPQSLETDKRISRLKRRFGNIDVREYLFDDYLILYGIDGNSSVARNRVTVHLLAIRHHRQLSFDFKGFWRSNLGSWNIKYKKGGRNEIQSSNCPR